MQLVYKSIEGDKVFWDKPVQQFWLERIDGRKTHFNPEYLPPRETVQTDYVRAMIDFYQDLLHNADTVIGDDNDACL